MEYEEDDGLDGDTSKTCARCRFFRELMIGVSGECRRLAPQPCRFRPGPHLKPEDDYKPEWPSVHVGDWCGEFEEHPHKAGDAWD